MSRRIDIELTSNRPDGTWTWRAAGAKQPKGQLANSLVPEGVSVGDVVKVDADFLIDGIEILSVLPPKTVRAEPERLEILGSGKDEPAVTTQLVTKERGRGRERRRDGDKRSRSNRRDGARRSRDRQPDGDVRSDKRSERSRKRPPRDDRPATPKAKKLRPKRTHRSEVLAGVPDEQRPIAEQVLRGGLPAVRTAIEAQNEGARNAGQPEIDPAPLLKMAEDLLPALKAAEWHDRADAALAMIDEVSLADLRSVVVAADGNTRSDETRALAEQLRSGLSERVERDQQTWLNDLQTATSEGRTVRALRLSSRPPKAGTPLPPDLLTSLAEQASASLTSEVTPQRWGTVLDAVSYSPVRNQVAPIGTPTEPGEELLATVRKVAGRVPAIAALFGVESPSAKRPKPKPPTVEETSSAALTDQSDDNEVVPVEDEEE